VGSAYAEVQPVIRVEIPQLFLSTLWNYNDVEQVQRGTIELGEFIKDSRDPSQLLKLGQTILNTVKVSEINKVEPIPEFIGQSFEIAKLLDAGRFTELSALNASHVALIGGLAEISQAVRQQPSYLKQLKEIVVQLSQGEPDVSLYTNTEIDPEDGLFASSGDVAISPTALENLRLRQEPNYDAVVVRRDIKITFFDYYIEDGDKIDVYLNGQLLQKGVLLVANSFFNRNLLTNPFGKPLTITLDKKLLKAGENVLELRSIDQAVGPTTIGVDFNAADTIYGKWRHAAAIPVGGSFKIKFGLPQIRVNGNAYPYSADHIIDTLREPRILTIDRPRIDERREANLKRYKEIGGIIKIEGKEYDQDESPPAIFAESLNAHVRLIPRRDNQDSGNQFGIAMRLYGSKKIQLQDGWNVDFFATQPTVPTPLLVPDVLTDWEYKII
jgi:Deoxyribonuclease NucA/NucB